MKAEKIKDKYLFEDNIRRYFLKEMLVKKPYLTKLTLEEVDWLVDSINTLISNLHSDFKNYKKMIDISDENNWNGNHLFRDIIWHTVLDIEPSYGGTTRDFKNKLLKRWGKKEE